MVPHPLMHDQETILIAYADLSVGAENCPGISMPQDKAAYFLNQAKIQPNQEDAAKMAVVYAQAMALAKFNEDPETWCRNAKVMDSLLPEYQWRGR
jgi:hypothetical protein